MESLSYEDPFSNEERKALSLFRPLAETIVSSRIEISEIDDDYLIRWLRARNLNVQKAALMLKASIEWRAELRIAKILDVRVPDVIENQFRYKFTGEDASGRPILVAPFGRWNIRRILESGLSEDVVRYWRKILEEIILEISKRRKEKVTQVIFLLDSQGLTFRTVTHIESMRMVFQVLGEFEDNYPEILHSCYIINAPWVFQYGFNLLKPLISSRTLSKIEIYDGSNDGHSWKAILRARLPPKSIPCEYGGTGQPFSSNASSNNCTDQ